MNESGLSERLREISIENYIWVIYIGIIVLSYVSNYFEKEFLLYKNEFDKRRYRSIMITIFIVLVFVYFYFLYDSYKSYKSLDNNDSYKKKELVILSLISSSLILLSGIIYLYIVLVDENVDVEIAFN